VIVHVTDKGRFHAFCDSCEDHNPSTGVCVCRSRGTKTYEDRHQVAVPSRRSTGSTSGSGSTTLCTPTTPTKPSVTWVDPEPRPLNIARTNTSVAPTLPRKSSRRVVSEETKTRTKSRRWF